MEFSDTRSGVDKALREIGEVIYLCLKYEPCPGDRLDGAVLMIENIINNPENLKECEYSFKAAGSSYILFFFSNIIYNLKTKNDLYLTQDVLRWLASVWKNFIQRNRSYQAYFPLMEVYSGMFLKYYSGDSEFINRLNNISSISDQFLKEDGGDDSELARLEKYFQMSEEILNAMKPTYSFLTDFFREMRIATGKVPEEAGRIEKSGLSMFGTEPCTYKMVVENSCKALGLLESVYLLQKKKKSPRQFRIFDGKKKFLTVSEIYDIYSEKFDQCKKELAILK